MERMYGLMQERAAQRERYSKAEKTSDQGEGDVYRRARDMVIRDRRGARRPLRRSVRQGELRRCACDGRGTVESSFNVARSVGRTTGQVGDRFETSSRLNGMDNEIE